MLLLRPTIAALRAAGERVALLAPESTGRVLLGPGGVDVVLPLDGTEVAAALSDGFANGPVARTVETADGVVAYTRSAPLLQLLGERARRLVHHDPAPPIDGPHAAAWLARAAASLVDSRSIRTEDVPVLTFTPAEQEDADRRLADLPPRFVAVHPGSGSPGKNWPLPRFWSAAEELAGGEPWLLVAGPAEEAVHPPDGVHVARDWPLRTLGAALSRVGLFVGNDAGVSHLAAASGATTLALFGPTDPALWSPVGPRVSCLRAPGGVLDALRADEVVAAGTRLRK